MNVRYGDTVQVTCVDNGQTLVADVLSFDPEKFLSVSLQKSIKLGMKYNTNTKEYFGDLYGKTFTSKGPTATRYTVGR
jgi:hypothetical protein